MFTLERASENVVCGMVAILSRPQCVNSTINAEAGILCENHYDDVIMDSIASQITSLTIVYSTVHSGADQRKHQSSASLAFVWEIHRWPVNFPHKWPVTRKMFPFDDVIMFTTITVDDTLGFCDAGLSAVMILKMGIYLSGIQLSVSQYENW